MNMNDRVQDRDGMIDPRFLKGIEQFNEREFFECHEVLEELWNDQADPEKQLTQGILQIAVGYYHYLRGNYEGTRKLFRRGLPRVLPFREHSDCKVVLDPLIRIVESGLRALESNLEDTEQSRTNERVDRVRPKNEPFVEIEIPTIRFK